MQLDLGNTDKLNIFYQDANSLEIQVVPPSVQSSGVGFTVNNGRIHYALAAVKGVGEGAAEQIVEERMANGAYASLEDFFSRVDMRQVNKRTLENLICAGAFDCFNHPRERIIAGLDRLVAHANRTAQGREIGQDDMFGSDSGEAQAIDLPDVAAWETSEKLNREFQSVGFYLSEHPLDEYKPVLEKIRVQLIADFENSVREGATAGRLAGTITSKQERKTRQGKAMGIVTISDPSGQYEAVIFEESLNRFREHLEVGSSIVLLAGADIRPEGISVRIQSVEPLEIAAARNENNMTIFVRDGSAIDVVKPLLENKGNGKISFVVMQENGAREVEVQLKGNLQVSRKLQSAVKGIKGVEEVELV